MTFPAAPQEHDSPSAGVRRVSSPPTSVMIEGELDPDHIVGESDVLRYVMFRVDQVAPTNATVLLLGETGTGKELVARAIHRRSPRAAATLVDRELRGAARDAGRKRVVRPRARRVHRRARGAGRAASSWPTAARVLLDEIGELPLELQPKLLRVLQEGQLDRLGSPRTVDIDVRVIAATNRDLAEEVRQGRFRSDLYYRLNVFPITLPSLRDRREDIPVLARIW